MFENNATAVAMTMGTADTLNNMLRGIGYPKITAAGATVDGKKLSESLKGLRDQIDVFLKSGE